MTVNDLLTKQARQEYDENGQPIPERKSTLLPTLGILAGLGGAGYLGHKYGDQIAKFFSDKMNERRLGKATKQLDFDRSMSGARAKENPYFTQPALGLSDIISDIDNRKNRKITPVNLLPGGSTRNY